jgi:hypothetical protein
MSGHLVQTGGHVTEVRTFAQRVGAIAERLGDVPLQITAQYYLSAAPYLSGDYRGTEHVCRKLMQSLHGQQTQEHLTTATTMYGEMDMRFWLEQAQAELGGLG